MSGAMGRSGGAIPPARTAGSMIRMGTVISVAASLLLLTPGIAAASTPTPLPFQTANHVARNGTTTTDVIALDSQTCTAVGLGTGCTLTVSTATTAAAPRTITGAAVTPMATGSGCLTFDQTLSWGSVGIVGMTNNIRVPVCWNGPTTWRNGWGPDCKVYPPPGYSYTSDWCNMYNNNTPSAQAGQNWHISSPWSTTYFWARVNFGGAFCLLGFCGLRWYWTGGQG